MCGAHNTLLGGGKTCFHLYLIEPLEPTSNGTVQDATVDTFLFTVGLVLCLILRLYNIHCTRQTWSEGDKGEG